jgi:hypothetical protein
MSKERKLAPHEAWDALEKMALHDEAKRVAALSDEELDRELGAEGIDAHALRARGEALAAKLEAKRTAAMPKLDRKAPSGRRKRWVTLLAAATLSAVAAAVAIPTAVMIARGELWPNDASVSSSDRENAALLRRDALHACDEKQWLECRHGLDAAKALDPKGDESPDVQEARRAIAHSP